jgi:hypothetical protein
VAEGRHKRDTDARRSPRFPRRTRLPLIAALIALAVTGAAVAIGVELPGGSNLVAHDAAQDLARAAPRTAPGSTTPIPTPTAMTTPTHPVASRAAPSRPPVISRSQPRTKMYAEVDLNLWTEPGDAADLAGELRAGEAALVTGATRSGRMQVLVDGATRWVTSGHLSRDKPDLTDKPDPSATPTAKADPTAKPDPAGGALSDAPCPDGSVESRLKPQTIRLYRAVCHAFPKVQDYLGWGARTEHDTGNAIDVMVYGDKALGDRIAAWAQAHAGQLDLYDILWYHRIWTPVRASEGWRYFADRGSATANHLDHVHLGTN